MNIGVTATVSVDGTPYRVIGYAMSEGLFEVGSVRCEIVSDHGEAPAPGAVVGKVAELHLERSDASQERWFHGLVAEAARLPAQDDVLHAELLIVPRLWTLTKRTDCRIFQKKSAVDVVKAVLDGAGVEDHAWDLTGSYAAREYIAQYRETDLEFAQRLLAEEGIYFFVAHDDGKDVVHFTDRPDGVGDVHGDASLTYRHGFGTIVGSDHVMNVEQELSVVTDKATLRDYTPTKPRLLLEGAAEGTDDGAHALEAYDYPARTAAPAEAKRFATIVLEGYQAGRSFVMGESGVLTLVPGRRFHIDGHPYGPINQGYLIVGSFIEGRDARQFAVGQGEGGAAPDHGYSCRFRAVPVTTTKYRPPPRERARTVRGAQTAIVTCPPGEEVHTDAQGRVKAQFPWDRLGKKDDSASCWMRTTQLALGGSMLLPRGTWEVVVRFEEGDTDRPVVTSRMYNAATPPPYDLPKHKGHSALQTVTTPGGGSSNEFKMNDSKGAEEFFVNASKDMTVDVGNNTTEQVGNDQTRKIGSNHSVTVTNSASASVGANQSLSVSGNQSVHVETFMSDQVAGDHSLTIGGNRTMMVGGDHHRTVTGDSALTVNGMMLDAVVGNVTDSTLASYSHKVGAALVEVTSGSRSVVVGGARNEQSGAVKIVATKGGVGLDVTGSLDRKVGGVVVRSVKGDESESATLTYMEVAAGAHIIKADKIVYEADAVLSIVMGASTITLLPAMALIAGTSVKVDGDTVDTGALILDN